jgi:hypothetical protein
MISVRTVLESGDGEGRLWLGRQRLRQPVEPVALAGYGDDQTRLLRVRLDLAAQPPDQHVHTAVERFEAPLGEGVQQNVAADDLSRPADERPQQSELPRVRRMASPESRASVQASRLSTRPANRTDDGSSREGLASTAVASRISGYPKNIRMNYLRSERITSCLPSEHIPLTPRVHCKSSPNVFTST